MITSEKIEVLEETERPDFICLKNDVEIVGIELTSITRGNPNQIIWDSLIEKKQFMSTEYAIELIQELALKKETKRNEHTWKLPRATILLIELKDIPLKNIEKLLTSKIVPDLFSTGFLEVWLADFTELESFNSVELFCVQPKQWIGYYPRLLQKPYG